MALNDSPSLSQSRNALLALLGIDADVETTNHSHSSRQFDPTLTHSGGGRDSTKLTSRLSRPPRPLVYIPIRFFQKGTSSTSLDRNGIQNLVPRNARQQIDFG